MGTKSQAKISRAPIPPTPKLRSLRGGVAARDPKTVDAPKHLSALATKIWRELAPGCFKTGTVTASERDVLGEYCSVLAADWSTARRAPELGRELAADLKLSPASRRRLERLALSRNEKPSDDVSHWS